MPVITTTNDGMKTVIKTFCGKVLCDREENYYDDSDGYVIVWDDEKDELRKIYTWTTRCGSNTNGIADATDEVRERAAAYMVKWWEPFVRGHLEKKAAAIEKGARVKVIAGKKIPKGTEGRVFWFGEVAGYTRWNRTEKRAGVELPDGTKVFTAPHNLERLDVEPIDENEVKRMCHNGRYAFHVPFAHLPVF